MKKIRKMIMTHEFKITDEEKIVVDRASFRWFVKRINRPPKKNPKLEALLKKKAPWEQ